MASDSTDRQMRPGAGVAPSARSDYPVFISYGMTKTGSTLAFELMRESFKRAGYEQSRLPEKILDNNSNINFVDDRKKFSTVIEYAAENNLRIVVKTHGKPSPAVAEAISNGLVKAHAVYRDPRDMALSLLDAGSWARRNARRAFSEIETLDDAIASIRNQARTLQQWLNLPGVVPLDYEAVAFDTDATLAAMQAHAGIEADRGAVIATVLACRFTQFNKGVCARHRTEMDPADAARILSEVAPLFRHMTLR